MMSFDMTTAEEFGTETAKQTEINGKSTLNDSIKELKADMKYIYNVTRRFRREGKTGKSAEWVLDNWYIAQREGMAALAGLHLKNISRAMNAPLPKLLAEHYLELSHFKLNEDTLVLFINGFQKTYPLSSEELSSLIPFLKAVLLHRLAILLNVMEKGEDVPAGAFASVFGSLQAAADMDGDGFFSETDLLDKKLSEDPAGIYPKMDKTTRALYRKRTAELAVKLGISQHAAAENIVKRSSEFGIHIGNLLFKDKSEGRARGYVLGIGFASVLSSLLLTFILKNVICGILSLIFFTELYKCAADFVILRMSKGEPLFRMSTESLSDVNCETLCIVSAVLSDKRDGEKYAAALRRVMLSNREAGDKLFFGILADLPNSESSYESTDIGCIKAAEEAVEELNRKYGERFFLFYRNRVYSEKQGCFSGWERKRGAITELIMFLLGENTGIISTKGKSLAGKIRYITVLDSDTMPVPGAVSELMAVISHPLNSAEIDRETKTVKSGFGIVQPKISVDLESAYKTEFTRMFAGAGGIDPYQGAAPDVYQELTGFGSFNGKGIIDINAYAVCLKDRFKPDTVLSHDLLEGELLKTGYAGDVEFTDGFPRKITSYYSRTHRWIRGDWQNISWINDKTFTFVSKIKVFDNLRRSLTAPAALISILISALGGGYVYLALLALAAYLSNELWSFFDSALNGFQRVKTYSRTLFAVSACVMRGVVKLMLLPYEGYISITAAAVALVRIMITHKNTLQWKTAADADRGNELGVLSMYGKMWIGPVLGLTVLVISVYRAMPALSVTGMLWLFSPMGCFDMDIVSKTKRTLHKDDKSYLMARAFEMWRYFEDNITAADHYLPPDNFQQQPFLGRARRTSPTNIGLALLSTVSAFDLNIISLDKCREITEKILYSVEKLKKCKGHLYNWYDTSKAEPMHPRYVSTVDSGNLAVCLLILAEFYRSVGFTELLSKAERLYKDMDFSWLYDKKRGLFLIGWDCEEDKPSDNRYDLFESEARATSYFAIAKGDVPKKHWSKLSRITVELGGYSGMVSWTGTMFEYLMPELFLPLYNNSAIYESAGFCVKRQMKSSKGNPWGISESAYYAFDHSMAYQYKANGSFDLALSRAIESQQIISPYSSFLALLTEPEAAVRNLKELESLGMIGKYGFFEAIDFTGRKPKIVRSFMVHHIGMSMLAVNNAVNDGIMQNRFMENAEMDACRGLLQERVPLYCPRVKPILADAPEKPRITAAGGWSVESNMNDHLRPKCSFLSRGLYSTQVFSNGKNVSKWGTKQIFRGDAVPDSSNAGVLVYLKTAKDVYPLQQAPEFRRDVEYGAEFTESCCRLTAKHRDFQSEIRISISEDDIGEKREVTITTADGGSFELIFTMEPVLTDNRDFESHPDFSKLQLDSERTDSGVVITRREKADEGEKYLAVSFSDTAKISVSKNRVFKRQQTLTRFLEFDEKIGAAPDMFITADIFFTALSGESTVINMSFSPSYNKESAILSADYVLKEQKNVGAMNYLDTAARFLGLDVKDIPKVFEDVPDIIFGDGKREKPVGGISQKALWPLGISGDIPIAVTNDSRIEQLLYRIKQHAFLRECGFDYDLVVITAEGGDYRQSKKSVISEFLLHRGLSASVGQGGTLHVLSNNDPQLSVLRMLRSTDFTGCARPVGRLPVISQTVVTDGTAQYKNDAGRFELTLKGKMPPFPWCNVIANENFGLLAKDEGPGFMWHLNSRENKLCLTQTIFLQHREETIPLFPEKSDPYCKITYGTGYARWEMTGRVNSKVTVFVPQNISAAVYIIELAKPEEDDNLVYFADAVLGAEKSDSLYVSAEMHDGIITARGSKSEEFNDNFFSAAVSGAIVSYTCNEDRFKVGDLNCDSSQGGMPCISLKMKAENRMIIAVGKEKPEMLKSLLSAETAAAELEKTVTYWKKLSETVQIKTPYAELDRYINGWSLYQIAVCRLFARTSQYQNGGAFGFRDQLQDVCAMLFEAPDIARNQILKASKNQFAEGDAAHWWHETENTRKGVRTRCSDDYLWLIYAACRYVETTGDKSILSEKTPYLISKPLEGEHDRYETLVESEEKLTLLQHLHLAAKQLIQRGTGEHGLCKIYSGDWNDGMNNVGTEGKGESVWLTFFAAVCLDMLAELTGSREYQEYSKKLKQAGIGSFDGQWFRRGYFDDGTPLGSHRSTECSIDSIAQSFALFAMPKEPKAKLAVLNAARLLFDKENGITKLFDPPFDHPAKDPGYIKGYVPGFRENGGQYTHAAVWLAIALLRAGEELGAELLLSLLPENHPAGRYGKEPFVIAADVYTAKGNYGLGGWSWYTGAAGWFRQAVLQELLGIRIKDGKITVEPNIPKNWPASTVNIRLNNKLYVVQIKNGKTVDVEYIEQN